MVGPNNAGKSTILTALRTVDVLLRYAHRRKPDLTAVDGNHTVRGYPINLREFPALRDSLRYEFGDEETRLELEWKSGARLTAVWPEETEADGQAGGYFYLTQANSYPVNSPTQAKSSFPPLGVIPILTPTEHSERLLEDGYVKQSISGRLSSRHFRNQLRLLDESGQLEEFLTWARPWMSDISFDTLGKHLSDEGMMVEAFFYEGRSRVPKEIVWAGDGIQVWLQLLYHIHRVRNHESIILDEPEVYLHPDLQRRLVHLLESTGRQILVATHSAEMVAESDGRLTTMVDSKRKRASRPKSDADFERLSTTLGTAFNLRLAKALQSRVVVFVEGKDMSVLRRFAKALSLGHLESETGVTIVPLKGYSNWGQVEPFRWICESLLPDALDTFVILDRDYRPDGARDDVISRLQQSRVHPHVWERKELESYLLTPIVIARLSGASEKLVTDWLTDITADMEDDVFSRLLDDQLRWEKSGSRHAVQVTSDFKTLFDTRWKDSDFRLRTCPPKQIISRLNDRLNGSSHRTISISALARSHRKVEISAEVARVLGDIEAKVSSNT
ncbi:AAA family ATPase [Nocardioidaceae bacterium SCSIO 66511]|nr:AAA family ATPase [Nocardioidaceae bacterium SCSIO 66511]